MIRRIIHIDEEKCNGCGKCVHACHEGAIDLVNGKARLMREHYCDGLGDCLPSCPTGAITFEEREAPAYDEAAVKAAQLMKKAASLKGSAPITRSGCSGSAPLQMDCPGSQANTLRQGTDTDAPMQPVTASRLMQWPVQIKLLPVQAPFYQGARLLIAADCTAYTYGDFHRRFLSGRTLLIGCPKLDMVDYSEKLTAIFRGNDIHSVTLLRMEVPCCGGLEHAVKTALAACGKDIPLTVQVVNIDGTLA